MNLKEMSLEFVNFFGWMKKEVTLKGVTRVEHDFYGRYRGPGHDYSFTPKEDGYKGRALGWGRGIEKGHILRLENKENKLGFSRYLVDEIRYFSDPSDMWSADLSFVPTIIKVNEDGTSEIYDG